MTPPEGLPEKCQCRKPARSYGNSCGKCGKDVPLPEEDAKTEGEPIIDRLTGERVGWKFPNREKELETSLSAARAEVERVRKEGKEWIKIAEQITLEKNAVFEELATLREENRRLREWQPIRSAPKTEEIWAFNGEPARMKWIEGEGYALWVYAEELMSDSDPSPTQPTYWFRLPAAPESKGGGEA